MIRVFHLVLLICISAQIPFVEADNHPMMTECEKYGGRTLQLCRSIVNESRWSVRMNPHTFITWGYHFPREAYARIWRDQKMSISDRDSPYFLQLTEWSNPALIRNTADGFLQLLTGQGRHQVPIDSNSIFHPENSSYVLK